MQLVFLYHLVFKGFAAAKKCTNEGRALMQLDFRQFVIQVKPATSVHMMSPILVSVSVKMWKISWTTTGHCSEERTTEGHTLNKLWEYFPGM